MDPQLKGKTAVVTGASRGIGVATVAALMEEGVRVVAAARTRTPGLAATGAYAVQVDLATPDGPGRPVEEALAGYGAGLASALGVSQSDLLAGLPAATGMTTGRLVEPSEVAALIVHLASPYAASITGTDHVIDGGTIKTV